MTKLCLMETHLTGVWSGVAEKTNLEDRRRVQSKLGRSEGSAIQTWNCSRGIANKTRLTTQVGDLFMSHCSASAFIVYQIVNSSRLNWLFSSKDMYRAVLVVQGVPRRGLYNGHTLHATNLKLWGSKIQKILHSTIIDFD